MVPAAAPKGPDKAEIINLFGDNDRRPQFRGKLITEGGGSIGDARRRQTNLPGEDNRVT